MGFVNYEPFIRFRQLTKLSRPGGRVSDRVTRSRVHALPILYREGPKHMCTCALSTVGRSGIPRRFRGYQAARVEFAEVAALERAVV